MAFFQFHPRKSLVFFGNLARPFDHFTAHCPAKLWGQKYRIYRQNDACDILSYSRDLKKEKKYFKINLIKQTVNIGRFRVNFGWRISGADRVFVFSDYRLRV